VKPDRLLTVRDIMTLNRDHFEGTPFDLTKGLQGGPYGNPNRYDKYAVGEVSKEDLRLGHFERPISMFRTSYSTVVQSRQYLPPLIGSRTWFGSAQPHATAYVPFYPGTTKEPIPKQWCTGSLYKFTREAMFWTVDFISNWAERMYLPIIPDIQTAQTDAEELALIFSQQAENKAFQLLEDGYEAEAENLLAYFSTKHATQVYARWGELAEHLITKFHDGFRLDDFHSSSIEPVLTPIWYPRWWMDAVGYWPNGDPHPVNGNSSSSTTSPPSPSPSPSSSSDETHPHRASNPDISGSVPESNSSKKKEESNSHNNKKKHEKKKKKHDDGSDEDEYDLAALPVPTVPSATGGSILYSFTILFIGLLIGGSIGYYVAQRQHKYEYVFIEDHQE